MPHSVAFHQDLHCLKKVRISVEVSRVLSGHPYSAFNILINSSKSY